MNRREAAQYARAAVTERAKSLFGESAQHFIQGEEITRHSQASAIIGIGNAVIDAIMIARLKAIRDNPHMPQDMINVAIRDGAVSAAEAIEATVEAASKNTTYMLSREVAIQSSDQSTEDLVKLILELNEVFHP